MTTRDQKRAERAYTLVTEIKGKGEKDQKKYGTMALKLPLLVRTAGLLGALDFVKGRKDEGQRLFEHVKTHLVEARLMTSNDDLLRICQAADVPSYLRLTQETLAVLLWHKRLAHSMLGVEAGDEAPQ